MHELNRNMEYGNINNNVLVRFQGLKKYRLNNKTFSILPYWMPNINALHITFLLTYHYEVCMLICVWLVLNWLNAFLIDFITIALLDRIFLLHVLYLDPHSFCDFRDEYFVYLNLCLNWSYSCIYCRCSRLLFGNGHLQSLCWSSIEMCTM